jgi:hypothetical protein
MGKRLLGLIVLALQPACGGSTDTDGSTSGGGGGGTAGSSASGGSSGTAPGGTGGGAGSGGFSGAGGSAGNAASGGTSTGGSGACSGLTYCDCNANAACKPIVEACFCPCGIEPCEPDCACVCSGGAYLGCVLADMDPFEKFIGTWLIGWAGGMNHYSWVRIEPDSVARFLDGAGLSVNAPFWNCNGVGNWHMAAKPETIALYFPAGCDPAFQPLTFSNMGPASGYPKGAILYASVEISPTQFVEAYKFPFAQCDAAMTTCTDPLL